MNADFFNHAPNGSANISYFSKGEVIFALEFKISENEFKKWCESNYGEVQELEHPTSIMRYNSFDPKTGKYDELKTSYIKNGLLWIELKSSVKKIVYDRDNQIAYYEFGF